ncbi:hypothetical protein EGT07_08845 [Herbaspirillum sp. HC18]|nr:hypothetical protein EGT07_08845 [Herbaspirillum sp. HC18]
MLNDDGAEYPCLLTQRNMVRFAPNAAFAPDVARFMEAPPCCASHDASQLCSNCIAGLEQTAALYRGEFMAGFFLQDCSEFEAWLQVKREVFRRHALSLLAQLADWHEKNSTPNAALIHAQRYIELAPWDESGQRRLMSLYAATGNSGAAMKQYEEHSRQLSVELGTTPDDATRALYEQLCKAGGGATRLPVLPPIQAASERRQVTVLYCELSAAEGDPEEVAALMQAPRQRAIELIHRHGGYYVQSHGAGLLAYFGYPRSIEGAAVLAARTALAISRDPRDSVSSRFGLHTGLIVTGIDAAIPDIAGQASAIAIRLCQNGEPGEIRLSDATHVLITGYFRCEALNNVFRLMEETGAVVRLEAAARLTPLVGRLNEVTRLTALWHEVAGGAGTRTALLRGDPGIGKSRLIQHFVELTGIKQDGMREMHCRPECQNTAFHPLSGYLENACDFSFGDSDEVKLGKLERHLAVNQHDVSRDALPRLADLLGIPTEGRDKSPALSPQLEKENAITLLLRMFTHSVAQQPLLLIVEDIHWADPSTSELLERLLDESRSTPLFVLLTTRPEFSPGWQDKVMQIDLPPLSDKDAAALIGMVDSKNSVPAVTVARIVAATDGVPLFIEETTRMLIAGESKLPIEAAVIPATLRDLLASRLDSIAEAKHLVQVCAAIGREFSSDLLDAVTPLTQADTAKALCKLEESGLISKVDRSGRPAYQFKHALIQEAAYQSQTSVTRREAHHRIAHALKAQAAQSIQAPEVLASHFLKAGEVREAVDWWRKAGARAARHGAVTEAIEHLHRALGAIPDLPNGRERDELELSLLVELGSALISSKGYGALEADEAYSKAFALSEKCGASLDLFRSIWGLYLGCSSRTTHSDAMLLAERLLQLAQQDGDPVLLITAHYACANSSYSLARFAEACRHMEDARRLYRPELDSKMLSLFGEHSFVSILLFGAWALWTLGRSEQALEAAGLAISIAQRVNHPQTLGFAYCFTGILHRLRGEPNKVREFACALSDLATKHGFAFWQVTSDCLLGWAQAAEGEAQGLDRITTAIHIMRAGVFVGAVMYFLEMRVESYKMLNRHEEQLSAIDEALDIMQGNHDRHFEAELYRLKGECLLKLSGDMRLAREWLERAQSVACAQGAAELEHRAVQGLAILQDHY